MEHPNAPKSWSPVAWCFPCRRRRICWRIRWPTTRSRRNLRCRDHRPEHRCSRSSPAGGRPQARKSLGRCLSGGQIRSARGAILAMGDDVGVPIATLKFIMRSRTPTVMICHHLQSKRARTSSSADSGSGDGSSASCRTRPNWHRSSRPATACRPSASICSTTPSTPTSFVRPARRRSRKRSSARVSRSHDYRTLLHATKGLDADLKIEATSIWYELPVNFTSRRHARAGRDLQPGHDRRRSATSTTPLRWWSCRSSRSAQPAGNTTILEGMAMGKPVIATDIKLGGDYIETARPVSWSRRGTSMRCEPDSSSCSGTRAATRHRRGCPPRRGARYSREQLAATLLSSVRGGNVDGDSRQPTAPSGIGAVDRGG